MKRISKKTRDEAILICAIAASHDLLCTGTAARLIGASSEADELSRLAWYAAPTNLGCGAVSFAEAEALLQCGWSPS